MPGAIIVGMLVHVDLSEHVLYTYTWLPFCRLVDTTKSIQISRQCCPVFTHRGHFLGCTYTDDVFEYCRTTQQRRRCQIFRGCRRVLMVEGKSWDKVPISTGQPFDWISAINSPSAFVPNSVAELCPIQWFRWSFPFLHLFLEEYLG